MSSSGGRGKGAREGLIFLWSEAREVGSSGVFCVTDKNQKGDSATHLSSLGTFLPAKAQWRRD